MKEELIDYQEGEQALQGFLVAHDDGTARPGVLIAHAFSGLSDFEKNKAREIASLGYNAFALDLYGKGIRGSNTDESRELMGRFMQDRALLRRRIVAALTTAKALDGMDAGKMAAIGFCLGGLCVLDLARSGADVKGVVSLHGLFKPLPDHVPSELIKSKVLALHGYDDPMVPPEDLTALATEFTNAGVDWQIHAYGLTYHSFTNPNANNPAAGSVFNPVANARAWKTVENFLT